MAVIDPHGISVQRQAVLFDDNKVETWKAIAIEQLANLQKRRAAHVRHQRSNSRGGETGVML
jgi:hypothetical protein